MTAERAYDELLVLRSQDGDRRALDELVRRWQKRFLRAATRLTGEGDAARDAVQEAWLAIVRGLARLDDPARFGPWAFRIVHNKSIDWVRRRGRQRQRDRDLVSEGEMSDEGREEPRMGGDNQSLVAALRALPREQQALLALHYQEGFRIGEIADILDLPAGTVKSRLFRARRQLREALEGE